MPVCEHLLSELRVLEGEQCGGRSWPIAHSIQALSCIGQIGGKSSAFPLSKSDIYKELLTPIAFYFDNRLSSALSRATS